MGVSLNFSLSLLSLFARFTGSASESVFNSQCFLPAKVFVRRTYIDTVALCVVHNLQ